MKIAEVIPNKLYFGAGYDIKDLRKAGMKYFLNIARKKFNGKRKHYPIKESANEDPKRLIEATNKIHRRLRSGKYPLYVHCYAGRNRSPTIIALYLIRFKSRNFPTINLAFRYLNTKKKIQPKKEMLVVARKAINMLRN